MKHHHHRFAQLEQTTDTSTLWAEKRQRQEASRESVRSGALKQEDLFLVPSQLARSLRIQRFKA
jgi:hypothetical protein